MSARRWRVYRSTVFAGTWVATDGYVELSLFRSHAEAFAHASRMARTPG